MKYEVRVTNYEVVKFFRVLSGFFRVLSGHFEVRGTSYELRSSKRGEVRMTRREGGDFQIGKLLKLKTNR